MTERTPESERFAELARAPRRSVWLDVWQLLREHKKWWLTPIVLMMLLLGWLALFAGGSAAPFIYTLF
ncbi:MAG TPA: DUF5989 family protein [Polyangiales bacterium]|nr:DUF5989 family protein [Polyangiales bacterium]